MKTKKPKKLSISFAPKSRKKDSISFRLGGTFISREKYLKESGLSEGQLKWTIKNIVDPATNNSGQLLKKDKKAVADLFNKFVDRKKEIPEKYDLKINLTSARSIEALKDKDIIVFYKGKENKFTYNDFIYFAALLLDRISTATGERVIYSSLTAKIDETKKTVNISL